MGGAGTNVILLIALGAACTALYGAFSKIDAAAKLAGHEHGAGAVKHAFIAHSGQLPYLRDIQVQEKQAAEARELLHMLHAVGFPEYYQSMVFVGLTSPARVAAASNRDGDDALIKPAHWRRIVQHAVQAVADRDQQDEEDDADEGADTGTIKQRVVKDKGSKGGGGGKRVKDTDLGAGGSGKKKIKLKKEKGAHTGKGGESYDYYGYDSKDYYQYSSSYDNNEEKRAPLPKEKAESKGRAAAANDNGEDYLLLSSLTMGFASGMKMCIKSYFAVCAATGRTCVLPNVNYAIPAFKTTSEARNMSYSPLGHFIDLEDVKRTYPCLKTATYEEWKAATGNTLDAALMLGTEKEHGVNAKTKPVREEEAFVEDCYPALLDEFSAGPPRSDEYWKGPWSFHGEMSHVIRALRVNVRAMKCISVKGLQTAAEAFGVRGSGSLLAGKRSVMVANWPCMKGADLWSTLRGKGPQFKVPVFEGLYDEACGKKDVELPVFADISWQTKVASKAVADRRFGNNPFTCVHIRGEKLALVAKKHKKLEKMQDVGDSPYIKRCFSEIVKKVKETAGDGGNRLFMIHDLDVELGSKSAVRDPYVRDWMIATQKMLQTTFPNAQPFCGTKDNARALTEGPVDMRVALRGYPGNCAMMEAGICRRASHVIRFGAGIMGEFASYNSVGGDENIKQYINCEDVLGNDPYIYIDE